MGIDKGTIEILEHICCNELYYQNNIEGILNTINPLPDDKF